MKKNEFLRGKPNRISQHYILDLFNWLFPICSLFIGFWLSAQLFARLMNFDPRIVGYPILILKSFNNYRIYHPGLYILSFLKYAFKPGFGPYFYASLKPGLIGVILALSSLLFFSLLRNYLQRLQKLYGTARWANKKDLKKFGLLQPKGMILGQLAEADVKADVTGDGSIKLTTQNKLGSENQNTREFICHSGKTNTLLIAPTRSGKNVSVIVPSLLSYPGSAIIFDPKGENWSITAGFRKKFSHVLKFSPISRDTIKFNPMNEIREGDFAYADANQIADILYTSEAKADQASEFFNNTAKDITTAVILHVKFSPQYKEKNLSTVLRLMSLAATSSEQDDESGEGLALIREMISTDHGDEDMNERITAMASRLTTNPKERASVLSTVFSKLQLFEDPLIANATSSSDFKIEDFIDSKYPISLYLTVPFAHIDRISPVFRLLINFMLRKFSEGETQFGEIKLKIHLVFFLDEFPILGHFPFIAKVMGILAGYGVTFLIVCQSLNQIIDIYGQNHPFLDHCKNLIIFQPAKIEDAKMFSEAIGKESVIHDNVSTSGRKFSISLDNLNLSSQEIARDLINPDELMKLPLNQCLIMNHGMPPYIGSKVVYYDDERFKGRVSLPVPKKREELLLECQTLPSNKTIDLINKEKKYIDNLKKQKIQKQEEKRILEEKKERTEFLNYLEPQPDEDEVHFSDPPDPDFTVLLQRLQEMETEEEISLEFQNEIDIKNKLEEVTDAQVF